MEHLLYKEFRLAANPLSYFFVLFAAMALIPGYPVEVGAFYICLGIFFSFQSARECHDILYSVLLPVKKAEAVYAKYWFCVILQGASLLLAAGCVALRLTVLVGEPYASSPLMPANIAFLGWMLVIFALFNTVFLGRHFRTAYNIGFPFLAFCIVCFAVVGLAETVCHIPFLAFLRETRGSGLYLQGAFFALCLVIYIVSAFLSARLSAKRFCRLDL